MTSAEFLAWVMSQPPGRRYELLAGEVVAMAPERWGHALANARVWRALDDAIRAGGLPCAACPDGMAVEIDAATVYEPGALVRCGGPDAVRLCGRWRCGQLRAQQVSLVAATCRRPPS